VGFVLKSEHVLVKKSNLSRALYRTVSLRKTCMDHREKAVIKKFCQYCAHKF